MADAVGVILISVNCACILCLVKDRFVRSCSMYWQRGKKLPDASHSLFIARRIMSPQADWHSQPPCSYGFLWCWRGHQPLHLKHLCKNLGLLPALGVKRRGWGLKRGSVSKAVLVWKAATSPVISNKNRTQNQNNYIFIKVWSCKMRLKMIKWK